MVKPNERSVAHRGTTLDIEKTYPCPACRTGELVPITLTDAWGCDRCNHIFEVQADASTLVKLAGPYQREQTWRWNGQQWVMSSKLVRPKAADIGLTFLLGCLFWFGVTQLTLSGFLVGGIIVLLLLTLVVLFWVVLRR